jgi:hypothetical protein
MSKYKGKVPRELYIPPEFVQKAHVVHWSSKRCGQARIEEMYPDMPIYEVYNVVTSVCEDPDIITQDVIERASVPRAGHTNSIYSWDADRIGTTPSVS